MSAAPDMQSHRPAMASLAEMTPAVLQTVFAEIKAPHGPALTRPPKRAERRRMRRAWG